MKHQLTVTRDALCALETIVEVDAISREAAEQKALAKAQSLPAESFRVRSIDLGGVEGSAVVEREG
jgi:hypothetical protein